MASVTAKTSHGEVQGREKEGVLLFGGIPYAAPPTGRRRFGAPEPHDGWIGVRDASRFGAAAPQPREEGLTANPQVRWDEDCLTLNVCTPALDDRRRPVLVWIHGGGFRTGQGAIPWYNGTSFAQRGDIVTVSINYRLGALGFAHLAEIGGADYASSGLNGIRDQIAALQWVRDNIAAFGGDPDHVTVAGESAGGMSVGVLLGCPAAAGLFRGAIPQSGAAHTVLSREEAAKVASRFAAALGARSIDDLLAAPVECILEAQMAIERQSRSGDLQPRAGNGLGGMPFQPVVDGHVLPKPPIDAVRAGLASKVRVLVGTNRDEMTLFPVGEVDEERLQRIAARIFADADAGLAAYRKEWPGATPQELFTAIMTDQVFRIPALRLAEAQAQNDGTAYQYLFTWQSRAFGGRLKATHALEIPFMFNNLDRAGTDIFIGPGPKPQPLADAMHAAWIAFIRTGNPTCDAVGNWPAYRPEHRAVMELGDQIGVRIDPYGATRAVWDDRL
ncbi:MAG TPA: carboxylesterase/lipase family protein [Candidatus Kryptonia bacterium]|nr:carboxylesterase/lipase family protein [Candidatus Kryptonia bacterium]